MQIALHLKTSDTPGSGVELREALAHLVVHGIITEAQLLKAAPDLGQQGLVDLVQAVRELTLSHPMEQLKQFFINLLRESTVTLTPRGQVMCLPLYEEIERPKVEPLKRKGRRPRGHGAEVVAPAVMET